MMENGTIVGNSAADDDSQDANKRPCPGKRKSTGETPQRAKRNRYISIACNECKRRKIKCNGETPCHRCGNLSLDCIYAPNCCSNGFRESEEYSQMNRQLTSLQEQIDTLAASLDAVQRKQNGVASLVQSTGNTPSNSYARESPAASAKARGSFAGPGRSSYDYNMGSGNAGLITASTTLAPDDVLDSVKNAERDPLIEMSSEEALRLCAVYEEEVGSILPMINIETLMAKVKTFWSFMESMRRVGFLQKGVEDGDSFMDGETIILKLVLAIAAIIDGGPSTDVGRAIFANTKRISAQSSGLDTQISPKTLRIWILMAQYHFYSDNEVQAYRTLGLAARGCFELGIHRNDILIRTFTDPDEAKWVVRLFWVIYYLDRHYGFGTGMPFAMQDADIDPQLPEPDEEVPFLQLMATHGRISSKVWTSIAGFSNQNIDARKSEMGFLDYNIQQWQSSVPDALRYQPTDNFADVNGLSRRQRRLRLTLHLYANLSRIQLYRPVLYSITSIMEDRGYAQTVVEIAKDTIRTLAQMQQIADLGRRPHYSTNFFLIGALAVLFLAVAHAPMEFNAQVREEFYMALELVRNCSSNSFVSRRLWNTIKGLKELAPKLGLAAGQPLFEETGNLDPSAPYRSSGPVSGQQMSFELTNLFEAASGYPGLVPNREGIRGSRLIHNGMPMDSFSMASGHEEEFLRIMKECF